MGKLFKSQSDETLYNTWKAQGQRCPMCQDKIPWHRGVVLERETFLVWACLICVCLESDLEVPLPPGFRFVWIHQDFIEDRFRSASTVSRSRSLGFDSAEIFYRYVVEQGPDEIRLTPPKQNPDGPFKRFLLPSSPFHDAAKGKVNLLRYVQSKTGMEVTNSIHSITRPNLDWNHVEPVPGHASLFLVSDEELEKITERSAHDRRDLFPRVGVATVEAVQNLSQFCPRLQSFPIPEWEGEYKLYMIPWLYLMQFYRISKAEAESHEEFARLGVKPTLHKTPGNLWSRIFGMIEDDYDLEEMMQPPTYSQEGEESSQP